MHPVQRRYWAENLVRRRRSDEQQRYAASQRQGRIDPNPHQIDAVIFALRRIPEGGCILADEVGLGKTIEAGLVIAQLLAEGARRILILLPKPLMGQWQQELYSLFGVETREASLDPESLAGDGVFVAGREFAGSERGASLLRNVAPFDLCVIDEAHEIFAGIYKRYRRDGAYQSDSDEAKLAGRVRSFLGPTPVMLLTATPIQNALTELWGLVQYVEPTGTLLGNLGTFRDVFCEPGNDRALAEGQAAELRQRINRVCQRTLRRQAQDFLERPFTRRQAKLFEYSMSPQERQLYEDVTSYLLEPDIVAFSGSGRRLLLISFHRIMASSIAALAKSLGRVADRLRAQLEESEGSFSGDSPPDPTATRLGPEFSQDLEDEELGDAFRVDDAEQKAEVGAEFGAEFGAVPGAEEPELIATSEKIRREWERVERFAEQARNLAVDSKAERLKQVVQLILQRGENGAGSGKMVIFTESLTTQAYLRKLLLEADLGLSDGDITLFRGTNDSRRAAEALAAWQQEIGDHLPSAHRPSRDVAMRLALVHEFRSRSKIFISTEAGAKGLNLQFCETLVNFDLPWNPQRIEQRIGRCHRYSQQRDVTVINFLSRDNEAQRLTFQILSEKLDLFGEVLDASDVVLHGATSDAPEALTSALGADFEHQLRRIYERARTKEELSLELKELSDSMDEQRKRFEQTQQRMEGLIQTRFDESVRAVFRQLVEELPQSLAAIDQEMDRVLQGALDAENIPYQRTVDLQQRILFEIPAHPGLPLGFEEGGRFVIGEARELPEYTPIHLGHGLLQGAVEEARQATANLGRIVISASDLDPAALDSAGDGQLVQPQGQSGRLVLAHLQHDGFEPFELVEPIMLLEGQQDPLPRSLAHLLVSAPIRTATEEPRAANALPPNDNQRVHERIDNELLDDVLEEYLFDVQSQVTALEQQRFEQAIEQIEQFAEDQLLVQRREQEKLSARLEEVQARRAAAVGPETRSRLDGQAIQLDQQLQQISDRIAELESRQDADYQRWRDSAHHRRYAQPQLTRLIDVEFELE